MDYTEVLTSLRRIIRTVNLESKRIEKQHGISIPQLLCLNFLNASEDFKASHKQIKDFLSLNASTVTGIINRLEKKGLVAKLPKREDRRVTYITITDKGARLIEHAPDSIHDRVSKKLATFNSEQLQQLEEAFQLITDILEPDEEGLDAAPIITGEISIDPDS